MSATVRCDTCNEEFNVDFEDIPKYHDVPCEECGEVLVNDYDMLTYEMMVELKSMGLVNTDMSVPLGPDEVRATVETDGKGGVSVTPHPSK